MRPSLGVAPLALAALLSACLLAPSTAALGQEPSVLPDSRLPCRADASGRAFEQPGPGLGCQVPIQDVVEPFTGTTRSAFSIDDASGDGVLDLLSVAWAPLSLTRAQAESIREDPAFVSSGRRDRAAREGSFLYFRLVYSGAAEGAGLHLATDRDGRSTNDSPSSLARPDSPLAGRQLVLSWFPATRKALSSNLAMGDFYRASLPFLVFDDGAAAHLLVPGARVGSHFSAASFTPEAGWDRVDAAYRGSLPVDGRVEVVVICAEGHALRTGLLVERLSMDGQIFQGLTLPLHRNVRAVIRIPPDTTDHIRRALALGGEAISLPISVNVDEQGTLSRQRGSASLLLIGEDALGLIHDVGLTQQGFHVIVGIDFDPSGDALIDALLARISAALVRDTPPARIQKRDGLVFGDPALDCLSDGTTPPA